MKNIIFEYKFRFIIMTLSVVGITIDEILKAFLIQYIIDSAMLGTIKVFEKACMLALGYLMLMLLLHLFYDTATNSFIRICMESVKIRWMNRIKRKQLYQYDFKECSKYISNFTVDTALIEEDYLKNLILLMKYLITGLASLYLVWSIHCFFVIFIILTFWLPLLINHLCRSKMMMAKLEASQSSAKFTATLKEFLMAFEVSRMYGILDHIYERFKDKNKNVETKRFWSRWLEDTTKSYGGIASLLIWMGTLLLGAYLTLRGVLTVGKTIQVNQLLNNVVNPLYRVSFCLTKMKAADDIFHHIEAGLDQENTSLEGISVRSEELSGFWDAVECKSVGVSIEGRPIFHDVNLRFEKGKKYLLTGESGCGKSTFLRLLLNCYQRYDGKILVDGRELSRVKPESWYELTAVVSQSDFLFHDTLKNNLLLFQTVPDETVYKVMKICHLEKFIESHSAGLEFMSEENGKDISGGERQRICLARALLKTSPVLILDEATSALDSLTAKQIEEAILDMGEITVISVSHKIFPELIERYDEVIRFG